MLTVLFATFNRARLLRQVLEAFCQLESPPDGWSLVVIDNGSSDDTQTVLSDYASRLPMVSLIEKRPGKNAALNAGLTQAKGDLYVFTDDDVFPSQDWLCRLRHTADENPRYSIFGGQVVPKWEIRPEQWILDWVPQDVVFTLTDPSWSEGPMEPRRVFGPNMAVRAAALSEINFDPSIGPSGSEYAMGSETELVVRLAKRGYLSWHARTASVEHFIRREQLNLKWILGRAVRYGRGQCKLAGSEFRGSIILGVSVGVARRVLGQRILLWTHLFMRNHEGAFRARWALSFYRGWAEEARRAAVAGAVKGSRRA